MLRGANDFPKPSLGRMLRGGGTTLNSSSGTTVHLGLLRGANDFPKPSLGRMLRGGGTTLNSWGNDRSPWFAERRQ